jgi:carbon monoxide dehydrogenase subunit G
MAQNEGRDTFRVERDIAIAAPAEEVFGFIVDFHRWVAWSPWEGIDPNMRRTYSGPDAGRGATYEWEGIRKVGKGRMEILDAEQSTDVRIKLDFITPFKAQNVTRFTLRQEGDTTLVNWSMTGPKTLMSKVMGIFMSMDKLVGRDFEKGLAQLKSEAES